MNTANGPITTRFAAWLTAYEKQREVNQLIAEEQPEYNGDRRQRRRWGQLNTRAVRASERERAARARLSKADLVKAQAYARGRGALTC